MRCLSNIARQEGNRLTKATPPKVQRTPSNLRSLRIGGGELVFPEAHVIAPAPVADNPGRNGRYALSCPLQLADGARLAESAYSRLRTGDLPSWGFSPVTMTRISNRLKRLSGPGSHINPVRMDAKPEAVHERVADSRICLRAEGSRRLPIFVDIASQRTRLQSGLGHSTGWRPHAHVVSNLPLGMPSVERDTGL
jgi:hypothetical protein